MKEFWTDVATEASWNELTRLSKEIDFALIGGWAAFLWSGRQKSKDIDIIVDYRALSRLKERYGLEKNEKLKKYEAKSERFDIDVYVPFFSELPIPPQDILEKYNTRIKAIRVSDLETLLVLKQAAYADRKESVKGLKDAVDVLNLLFYAEVDWKHYRALLEKYGLRDYAKALAELIRRFDAKRAEEYLGVSFKEFGDGRKKTLEKIESGASAKS